MAKRRGNHEGSIYQKPNGTWRAQVSIKGRRLNATRKTQKECRAWIKETIKQIDSGLTYEAAHTTYEEFISNWLVSTQSSLRPKTWHQYNQLVRDSIIPKLGRIKLIELRPDLIQGLYDDEVKAGRGLRTVQLIHAVIHRSLNHAVRLGLIGHNPDDATTPPKPKSREMKIYDETQAQQLLITAQANRDRLLALYHLALTTGMRQGELLGLKWQDIDWERQTISINRQLKRIPGEGFEFTPPKTKSGIRKVKIGKETIKILLQHQQQLYIEMQVTGEDWQEQDLVFPTTIGTPLHNRTLLRRFKKLIKDASLPEIRFHDLRHTAASLMLNHGIPLLIVSRRLGHAKPSITLDVYGHIIPTMQEQAAEVMDQIITPISWENCTQTTPGIKYPTKTLNKTPPYVGQNPEK